MDRPIVCKVDFYFGTMYLAEIKGMDWRPHILRRDGSLSSVCYDGSAAINVESLTTSPNSAWFKTREECQANVDKWFPLPAKPKKVRVRKKRAYYKVVKVEVGRMYSAAKSSLDYDGITVEYKVGEVIKPILEGSRLFVFSDLDKARLFVNYEMFCSKCKIFKCEVSKPKRVRVLARASSALRFWKIMKVARQKKLNLQKVKKQLNEYFTERSIPTNSYSVDSLKLIEEVK